MAEWYTRESKANLAAHIVKQEADLAAARAEIERLTKAHDTVCGALAEAIKRAEKAEAGRDEARAQVAMAFEAAAKECGRKATSYLGKGADTDLGSRSRAICEVGSLIRALASDHAQAALEAYGREKVREGMKMAADLIDQNFDRNGWRAHKAILAAMEKEGGE